MDVLLETTTKPTDIESDHTKVRIPKYPTQEPPWKHKWIQKAAFLQNISTELTAADEIANTSQ